MKEAELEVEATFVSDMDFDHPQVEVAVTRLRQLNRIEPVSIWETDRTTSPGTFEVKFEDGRTIEADITQPGTVRVLDLTIDGRYTLSELRGVLDVTEQLDLLVEEYGLEIWDATIS